MPVETQLAIQKTNELREQYIDNDFRKELEEALFSHKTIAHPIIKALSHPTDKSGLMKMMALQGYQLTKNFARYVGGLYNNCPIGYYRKRLAINLYEEETGMLSKTANHEVLMQRFIRALGISDEERDAAVALPATQKLIDYRWNLVNNPETFHMGAAAIMIASEGQNLEEEAGKARHELLPMIYGFKPEDLAFFSVHAHEDIFHVREGLDCVAEVCTTRKMKDEALEAVHTTCELFWKMYDGIQDAYDKK
jgi:pyrroloquinoline-quinone synthase